MNYITPEEAAAKWNLSPRRVQFYCANAKIPGIKRVGRQWLIPMDAQRPVDGRTIASKRTERTEIYHFPILIHTPYFASRSELSGDEKALMEAQLMQARSEYEKSIWHCDELLAKPIATHIRFGAYYTKLYNSALLGLYTELQESLAAMEELIEKETEHQEDYRLILAGCKFLCRYDTDAIQRINVNALSSDALYYYEGVTLLFEALGQKTTTRNTVQIANLYCKRAEDIGALPTLVAAHGIAANLCGQIEDFEEQRKHTLELCRISHAQGYIQLLAKYAIGFSSRYRECMNPYGSSFIKKVEQCYQRNFRGVTLIGSITYNLPMPGGLSRIEAHILLLLSGGTTNRGISTLLHLSSVEISDTIRNLCAKYKLKDRRELVQWSKTMFVVPNK